MKKSLLAMIFLGFILVLAACGGNNSSDPVEDTDTNNSAGQTDDSSSDEATSNNVDIIATNWDFDQDEYVVTAGEEVKLTLTNDEGMHGIVIDGIDVQVDGDGETTFTATEPGEYSILCSIPCGQGHNDMVSTLIVQ